MKVEQLQKVGLYVIVIGASVNVTTLIEDNGTYYGSHIGGSAN